MELLFVTNKIYELTKKPKLTIMKTKSYLMLYFLLIGLVLSGCDKSDTNKTAIQIDAPDGYELVWSDEFDDPLLDIERWQYETGDGTDYGLPAGWGNDEKQTYTVTADNSSITTDQGANVLRISAQKSNSGSYTSAKLTTKNFVSVRFGRVDVRAKMPSGKGLWPAIWMLGNNIKDISWPGCGEIDIAEMLGHEPNKMYATLHYTNGENKHEEVQGSKELSDIKFSDAYHVFSVDWDHEKITFLLDNTQVNQVPIAADMKEFLRSFYLILNVAVGGNWPGNPDETTIFPQSMYVDYVRVFEKKGYNAPDAPELNIDEETIGQNIDPSVVDHAIKDGFSDLGAGKVIAFGGGGEPTVGTSSDAIDGDLSLSFEFPGEKWGGAYVELEKAVDLSTYTTLKFSIKKPTELIDAEIKIESVKAGKFVKLKDYAGTDVGNGFLEYSIPLSDFTEVDLSEINKPFGMWNPQDATGAFVKGTVLIDNLYFAK